MARNSNSARADKAEEYAFSRIKEVLLNKMVPKDIVANVNRRSAKSIKPLFTEKATIEMQLADFEMRKVTVFDLYEGGDLSKDLLTSRIKEIVESQNSLVIRRSEVEEQITINSDNPIPYCIIKDAMQDFNKLINAADKDQRKMFLQLIIKKITVGDNRKIDTIEIHFNESIRNIVKNFLGEESSDNEDSSPFLFSLAI
ncbi:hypothetical protein [Alkalibacter mobilis]|uniref:hypothetical protein n=1 Tax=Alkalibacter mobilis TaxID=2787712 RepID=UPI00189FE7DC|nr:hypothetical protein [Alkalibacter mobilis]MBF7097798.1 hypothetical protein [Alkalibacter mobilis]